MLQKPSKKFPKLPGLPSWRRFSIQRLGLQAISIVFALQVLTAAILSVIALLRERRKRDRRFPYLELDEIRVGKNTLQIYSYGRDLYDAMLVAIDGAQKSIYLETYIWKDDPVGREFKEHLTRKAEQGVQVYVIFDAFANLVVPRAFKVFPPTIHAMKYQAIRRPWHIIDPRHWGLNHHKLLVVDGSSGFIGGYNIGSVYATKWRDTHLSMSGPAVSDLAQSFIDFWNSSCAPKNRITERYPRQFDPVIAVRDNDALRLTFPIRDMYIEAVGRAERTIWLANAYFLPDHILLDSLKSAATRGVDVRVLIPWFSNHAVADWITRGYLSECLNAGIRIFGYRTMLHAKTCTIDGQWSTIGTANLDRLSSIGNFEINVEVYSTEFAQQMETLYNCDLTNAFELTFDEWIRRPWYSKISERLLAPLRFIL